MSRVAHPPGGERENLYNIYVLGPDISPWSFNIINRKAEEFQSGQILLGGARCADRSGDLPQFPDLAFRISLRKASKKARAAIG